MNSIQIKSFYKNVETLMEKEGLDERTFSNRVIQKLTEGINDTKEFAAKRQNWYQFKARVKAVVDGAVDVSSMREKTISPIALAIAKVLNTSVNVLMTDDMNKPVIQATDNPNLNRPDYEIRNENIRLNAELKRLGNIINDQSLKIAHLKSSLTTNTIAGTVTDKLTDETKESLVNKLENICMAIKELGKSRSPEIFSKGILMEINELSEKIIGL